MTQSDAVTERFYAELHAIAERVFAGERSGHTLQPTAVVNEACLRLLTTSVLPEASREDRLALGGRVLKQVLIDHARSHGSLKRGAGLPKLELTDEAGLGPRTAVDVTALNDAIERLRGLHTRQAEVLTLRVFAGLGMEQIAAVIGTSKRTVEADWTVGRAWLRRELDGGGAS